MYSIGEIAAIVNGEIHIGNSEQTISNYSFDSRSIKNNSQTLFFALKGATRDGHDYIPELIKKGVTNFIVSKNLQIPNCNYIKVDDGLEALQNLAKHHRAQFNIPIIGITGSHGKTIVKEWLYQLLSPEYTICRTPKSYNSQLGVPYSILGLNNKHTLGIFEAGISQAGEMSNLKEIIQPTLGVFTGIGNEHQSGFDSIQQKEQEKRILFQNADTVLDKSNCKSTYNIPFEDKASIDNCLTCISVMEYLDYDFQIIQERISNLSALALRMELFKGVNNTIILNDSYSINLESLQIAIDKLNTQANTKKRSLIISDISDYNYASFELSNTINKQKISTLVTIGENKLKGILSETYSHYSSTSEFLSKHPMDNFQNEAVLIKGARSYKFEQIAAQFEQETHQTVLTVNLKQVQKNLSYYKSKLNPNTKLMVMVKAFAYGSGSIEVPKLLQHNGVDYLGVAYTDTGIKLREHGITIPIMVMNPEPASFNKLVEFELEPEIYSLGLLDQFIRKLILLQKKEYPIHIKIDTGMNRLGFKPNQINELTEQLQSQPEVIVKTIFSHLSSADLKSEKEFTQKQITLFDDLSKTIENAIGYSFDKHILNTSGIQSFPEAQFDMVRLGIGLYGINPTSDSTNIKPASSLETIIIQKKEILPGDAVGYGKSFIADKKMTIGILPIGYADGLSRFLGNGKFQFIINGHQAKTLGNICMDLTIIDLTNIPSKEGDKAEVFGKNQSIYTLSKALETIPYEVLTSISQRVKRVFIDD